MASVSMNAATGIPIVILAIAGYAIVNAIEISVVGANRIRVRHLAEDGSRRAQALVNIHEDQERFFASIVLLQNIFVTVASIVGGLVANEALGSIGFLVAIGVIPVLTAQYGEYLPKVLAAQAREGFALSVAIPTRFLTTILTPVAAVIGLVPNLIARFVFGVRLTAGPSVTEAELRMLIDMGAEAGQFEEHEAELLDRVFHFGDRRVHEVMVPRTETVWLAAGSTVRDFYAVFAEHPHSRFPLCDPDPDHVLGIVGIKDVLRAVATGAMTEDSDMREVVREGYFVPDTKLVGELFREMQAKGVQIAIAVDEYGGTAGIVTLEQLLEEMVGNVSDELGLGEVEVQEIDQRTFHIDGGLSIEEAGEILEIEIPDGDYDTLAGYVLSALGHIPSEGETVPIDGYRITVIEMKGQKIETLKVTRE